MSEPTFNRNLVDTTQRYNRGNDTKEIDGVSTPVNIGLYTIDNAILKYMQEKIKPVVSQDNKQVQVPIIYGNPERWKSVQQDGAIRDKNGKILLPIIMLRRTGMKKSGINSPVNKYQRYIFKTGWNPRNIYDRFAVQNNITPSEVYHSSIIPDYYDISYTAMVWTEYMQQMNRIIEDISFESNEYWGETNNYRFISRIDRFDQSTELPAAGDRMIRNKFTINVRAYILPKDALDKNEAKKATTKLVYGPKKVVFTVETVTGSLETNFRKTY